MRIALRVGDALDKLGVAWIVGGSVASSIHGIPRATQDIDLVLGVLRVRGDALDRAYMAEQARDAGLLGLLMQATEDSPPPQTGE